jgi:hypothetical protein
MFLNVDGMASRNFNAYLNTYCVPEFRTQSKWLAVCDAWNVFVIDKDIEVESIVIVSKLVLVHVPSKADGKLEHCCIDGETEKDNNNIMVFFSFNPRGQSRPFLARNIDGDKENNIQITKMKVSKDQSI